MILQGVQNMYEIDTSMAVIDKATELTGVELRRRPRLRRLPARGHRPHAHRP